MGFGGAVKSALFKNYANFSGRAPRSEYWWFQLFQFILYGLLALAFFTFGGADWSMTLFQNFQTGQLGTAYFEADLSSSAGMLVMISAIAGIVLFLPNLALTVRRFHDLGLSMWWVFLLWIISVLTTTVIFAPMISYICSITKFVISIIQGTSGPNRYGPDPL